MSAADADAVSDTAELGAAFIAKATNFEVLSLSALGAHEIEMDNLGFTTVNVAGSTAAATISGLAAGSTVEWTAALTGALTTSLKTATGTADSITLISGGNGSVTAASIETVNVSSKVASTLTLTATSATTVNVTGAKAMTLDLTSMTATTVVDASGMTAALTLVADGAAAGTTVTGGTGADVLTASGARDTLIGGAGADTLTGTTFTTLTGGAGDDIFVMNQTASTNYNTITDLSAGDVIRTGGTGAADLNSTAITLTSTASFNDYLTAAMVDAGAGEASWFQFGGNTYLIVDVSTTDGATYSASEDMMVQITGLVDLSTASVNANGDIFI
jgi:S-layer protein